jgi:DNA-binding protein H-NS
MMRSYRKSSEKLPKIAQGSQKLKVPKRMATTYLKIAAQIEKLQAKASSIKDKERAGVLKRIKEAIDVYGITAEDLGLASGKRAKKGTRKSLAVKHRAGKRPKAATAVKFRDGNGNTWGGRGPRPAWLRTALASGASLESFSV